MLDRVLAISDIDAVDPDLIFEANTIVITSIILLTTGQELSEDELRDTLGAMLLLFGIQSRALEKVKYEYELNHFKALYEA